MLLLLMVKTNKEKRDTPNATALRKKGLVLENQKICPVRGRTRASTYAHSYSTAKQSLLKVCDKNIAVLIHSI